MLKVILVDDEKAGIYNLEQGLKEFEQIDIIGTYTNASGVLEVLDKECVDAVFLDINMKPVNGLELAQKIKEIKKQISIVFVTAYDEYAVEAFEIDAVDYLLKPVQLSRLEKTVKKLIANNYVNKSILELEKEANIDFLTGLFNRRYIMNRIENRIKGSIDTPLFSIIMGDVDYFKQINDRYGHICGDYVLKEMSLLIKHRLRKSDVLSRWGGEEFLVLLPETDIQGAQKIAEDIRIEISNNIVEHNTCNAHVTITFGVAQFLPNETFSDLLDRADKALYKGKKQGKNCVVVDNTEK